MQHLMRFNTFASNDVNRPRATAGGATHQAETEKESDRVEGQYEGRGSIKQTNDQNNKLFKNPVFTAYIFLMS